MRTMLLEIFDTLHAAYGPRFWWPAETPFEVCVGAILTQNTNWGNVEKAIVNLKREGLLVPEKLRDIPTERLAELIRPAGYFNVKSARLKDFIGWLFSAQGGSLVEMFSGDWRELRAELLTVRGIGPETCDSILLYAGHKPSFVVDTYTKRLFSRLELISPKASYDQLRDLFMENLPPDVALFNEYHALIVEHCTECCRTRPLREGCTLRFRCGYYRQDSTFTS
ncbi:MAG: endonuclease III domain-containing protein [Spirochaetales bacterium]|nr:MAG: endonuclease III domain-containing protein [Spirochaetales bacterium]